MNREPKFEIYPDRKKQYRWRLRAANGAILADSAEGYTRARRCREALFTVLKATSMVSAHQIVELPRR